MREITWLDDVELERPLMVVALAGLFDAAGAATAAVERLTAVHGGAQVAAIDPESFFNFQQQRPEVRISSDGSRQILWPGNVCHAAHTSGDRHDLVTLAGIEPHLRWRTFADALIEIARRTGAEMIITLGAMVAMAPHTRPLGVVGSAANAEVAERLGLGGPSYEGPTGLVGALHTRLDAEGIPVVSLRVAVPHYVPSAPNPEATRSLLARFELVTGIASGHEAFDTAAKEWRARIDTAVAGDEELAHYVRRLEHQVDVADVMPSGDDLAAELEAFLRDRRDGD